MSAQALPSVALLAGGLAQRLRPITSKIPKAMVEVAGEPFVNHQLRRLKAQGIERAVFCLGFLGEQVVDHVGDGSRFGMRVEYSFDGEKLVGTGGAIRKALPLLGDTFFVTYADSYLRVSYSGLFETFLKCKKDHPPGPQGVMSVFQNNNQWGQSNVQFAHGKLLAHDKRHPTAQMHHIDYGLSLLKTSAFEPFSSNLDEPLDLNDVFTYWTEQGKIEGYEVRERFYEIGTPERLAETQAFMVQETRRV